MSNAEFSISREHFETIMQFVDFMCKDKFNINKLRACLLLFRIEDEMKKYENKGCDAVIELCQKMRTTPRKKYRHGKVIKKAMDAFINAVNEVVSDEVFNSV